MHRFHDNLVTNIAQKLRERRVVVWYDPREVPWQLALSVFAATSLRITPTSTSSSQAGSAYSRAAAISPITTAGPDLWGLWGRGGTCGGRLRPRGPAGGVP